MVIINLKDIGDNSDTKLLQKAVDMLDENGGKIIVPKGQWHSDGVLLKSNIIIELQAGSLLVASDQYKNYTNGITSTICEDSERAFLFAQNSYNIHIIGSGMIEGQSENWVIGYHELETLGVKVPAKKRPRMIVFEDCINILLADFQIHHAPMWTIHLTSCKHVIMRGLNLENDMQMPNTDGIDIDACTDVLVKNCKISGADDSVCLKTLYRKEKPTDTCHNIRVEDCILRSNSCAIKIGTETHNDIFDVKFNNCKIEKSNRAMGIFVRDGAHIYDIQFQNITSESLKLPQGFWGGGEAITIVSNIRKPNAYPGLISDIIFEHIDAIAHGAINIHGMDNVCLSNIKFKDIHLVITAGKDDEKTYDLRPGIADNFDMPLEPSSGRKNSYRFDDNGKIIGIFEYPEYMPGFWAQNVDGLIIENLNINYQKNTDFYKNKKIFQLMPSVTNIMINQV